MKTSGRARQLFKIFVGLVGLAVGVIGLTLIWSSAAEHMARRDHLPAKTFVHEAAFISGGYAITPRDDNSLQISQLTGEPVGIVRGHAAPFLTAHLESGELITIDRAGHRITTDLSGLMLREAGHAEAPRAATKTMVWNGLVGARSQEVWSAGAMLRNMVSASAIKQGRTQAPILPEGMTPPDAYLFRDCETCPVMAMTQINLSANEMRSGFSKIIGDKIEEIANSNALENARSSIIDEVSQFLGVRNWAIGVHPITNAQFVKFLDETGRQFDFSCGQATDEDEDFETPAHRPVECVSVSDAQAYAKWLADKTGKPYALPKIDQWTQQLDWRGRDLLLDDVCSGQDFFGEGLVQELERQFASAGSRARAEENAARHAVARARSNPLNQLFNSAELRKAENDARNAARASANAAALSKDLARFRELQERGTINWSVNDFGPAFVAMFKDAFDQEFSRASSCVVEATGPHASRWPRNSPFQTNAFEIVSGCEALLETTDPVNCLVTAKGDDRDKLTIFALEYAMSDIVKPQRVGFRVALATRF